MSRTARTRTTRASLLTGALIGALALTGCGAGQVANTAQQVSATGGANVEVGEIAVRDAVIVFSGQVEGDAVYTRGSDAPLSMTIVNEGQEADRIVSASSVWASEVAVNGASEVPGGRAVVVEGDINVTGGAAPGGSPTIDPNTAPTEELATGIVLVGLLDDLSAGGTYEVVLTFERAGELRMEVPVGYTTEPREEPAGEESE